MSFKETDTINTEIKDLKCVIDNQEEQIDALLEELEEYEEEIEDLEELVEKQGKALRDKDNFISMLERVIENQKNTSKLYKVLDYIDIEGLEEEMGLSFCMKTNKEGNIVIFLSEEVIGMNEIFDYEV